MMPSTDTEMGFVPRHIHELKHPHNQKELDVREREAAQPLEKVTRQRDVFPKHSVSFGWNK